MIENQENQNSQAPSPAISLTQIFLLCLLLFIVITSVGYLFSVSNIPDELKVSATIALVVVAFVAFPWLWFRRDPDGRARRRAGLYLISSGFIIAYSFVVNGFDLTGDVQGYNFAIRLYLQDDRLTILLKGFAVLVMFFLGFLLLKREQKNTHNANAKEELRGEFQTSSLRDIQSVLGLFREDLRKIWNEIPYIQYLVGLGITALVITLFLEFGSNLTLLILGIIIVLPLMFLFLIFNRVAREEDGNTLLRQGSVLSWTIVVVFGLVIILIVTSIFFAWPLNFTPTNLQNDSGNNQLVLVTPQFEEIAVNPDLPKITFRYDIETIDGLPYGWMYWGTSSSEVQKEIALPYTVEQMHANYDLNQGGDLVSGIDVSNVPKASYSSVIANDTNFGADIENVKLVIDSYEELPDRYINVWSRKGFVDRLSRDIVLDPNDPSIFIFDGENQVFHLNSNESLPIRLNILGAEPGIYTFHIEATVSINGNIELIESRKLTIAAPDPKDNSTLNILSSGATDELAVSLLNLNPNSFRDISRQFRGSYPTEVQIEEELNQNEPIEGSSGEIFYSLEDAIYFTKQNSLSGIESIAQQYQINDAIPLLDNFITENPLSDEALLLKVRLLFNSGNTNEAKQVAEDLLKKFPYNSNSHLAFWIFEPKEIEHLENAILYQPDNFNHYKLSAINYVVKKNELPNNFFSSFIHLPEGSSELLLQIIIQEMYKDNFGLAYREEDIAFLLQLNPNAEYYFWFLPEYRWVYKPLFDNVQDRGNSGVVLEAPDIDNHPAYTILRNVGRLETAELYAINRQDLIEILTLMSDFDTLSEFAEVGLDGSFTAVEYLFCGLASLKAEDWEMFDQVVAKYETVHGSQTNFLRSHYNFLMGNPQIAKRQYGLYIIQLSNQYFSDYRNVNHFESKYLGEQFHHGKRLSLEVDNSDNVPDLINEDLDIFLPKIYDDYTFWRLEDFFENEFLIVGRHSVFGYLSVIEYLEIDMPENETIVRIPDGIALVESGTFSSNALSPMPDVTPEEFLQIIGIHESFIENKIYSTPLSEDQMDASYMLHVAWYYYWNNSDFVNAQIALNQALELDPNFYDALVLRAKVNLAMGDTENAWLDFQEAEELAPLLTHDLLIKQIQFGNS